VLPAYPKYRALIFNSDVIICFIYNARSEVVWLCLRDLVTTKYKIMLQKTYNSKAVPVQCFYVCHHAYIYLRLQLVLSWPPLWLWVYPSGHPWDCSSWTKIMLRYSATQYDCTSDSCYDTHASFLLFFKEARNTSRPM